MSRVSEECPEPEDPALETGPTLVNLDEWSSICSTGHTSQILTGAFLMILREHFSREANIEAAPLKGRIYREDPEDTTEGVAEKGILIDPIYKWNPRDFEHRPAIYVKRDRFQTQRYGINDGLKVGYGKDAAGNPLIDDGAYHVIGVLGSHTLFCVSRSGAEVETLAYEVFREIQHFSPVIRRDLKLKKLAVTQVTEINKLAEYDQHFVAGVVVGWAYFEKWRLKQEAPWLKGFDITADPDNC